MNNNVESSESKTKNITLGLIVSWILGIILGIGGIVTILKQSLSGIVFLIAALILLPPVNTFMHQKLHVKISGGLKFILVIILFIIGGALSNGNNKNTAAISGNTSGVQIQPIQAPAQPTMTVSAVQLSSDYQSNQVAADTKYKGQLINLTGVIDNIGKDILGNPYIALKTAEYSVYEVQCMFAQSDEPQLATLSAGQSITLQGTVDGGTIDVLVDGCSIVK